MLTISETAAEAITTLLAHQGELPDDAGARIAADGEGEGLELALVAGPARDDTVIRRGEAVVYVDQQAAQVLGDKVLDVERVTSPGGEDQVQFAIVPQPG
jgi:Fe-S cluster assembly iron-binding protein IscA